MPQTPDRQHQPRFIFVTGGVVSSLGKGIAAASIGRLLVSRGLTVGLQKFDPYINVDPGTMSPYQHGEVFVTEDGAETDLDLGHYERFTDANTSRASNVTAGGIYDAVIRRERRGDYLGGTVQVVPHITDEIKQRVALIAESSDVDFVVGNPPYIRLENVPRNVMDAYRRQCPTMRGRADIYVGFIERGLDLLCPGGTLGFICADRWMHNQYGSQLRDLVSRSYAVETVITMHDVDAFEADVSAYPAVIVLRNGEQSDANVVDTTASFGPASATRVAEWANGRKRRAATGRGFEGSRLEGWFSGDELWPTGSPTRLAIIKDLESRFPLLEDPGTKTRVGIGVATGCDEVYITDDANIVEEDRLLPLLQASDITSGAADWSGSFLINPWDRSGLVDLERHPRLGDYLRQRLRGRHVARRRPTQWYRTIDRVDPDLQARPKLVIPDLKAAAHPVLDEGICYPHHNLYYVVSDRWDLEVLGGLLLSDVTNLFVGSYCVKMRGGCYRFQAQYLRRLRVPVCSSVRPADRRALARAFRMRDVEAATATAAHLYGLERLPRIR